jgi:hypothetical protein
MVSSNSTVTLPEDEGKAVRKSSRSDCTLSSSLLSGVLIDHHPRRPLVRIGVTFHFRKGGAEKCRPYSLTVRARSASDHCLAPISASTTA